MSHYATGYLLAYCIQQVLEDLCCQSEDCVVGANKEKDKKLLSNSHLTALLNYTTLLDPRQQSLKCLLSQPREVVYALWVPLTQLLHQLCATHGISHYYLKP